MKKIFHLTLVALTAFGVLAGSEEPSKEGERVKPGSKSMTHFERLEVEELRIQQETTSTDEKRETAIPQTAFNASLKSEKRLAAPEAKVNYTSHPGALFNPVSISPLGDTIEFHDGSIWSIAEEDTYKNLNWLTSDYLVVTPNHAWFSSYMFCITNQNTGTTVKANLFLGPFQNGIYTHWIVSINYYTQELCLEDGSIWKLSGFDSSIFNRWNLNHTIMIGVNDGFLSSSKPNILINVNTLDYSKAKCIY